MYVMVSLSIQEKEIIKSAHRQHIGIKYFWKKKNGRYSSSLMISHNTGRTTIFKLNEPNEINSWNKSRFSPQNIEYIFFFLHLLLNLINLHIKPFNTWHISLHGSRACNCLFYRNENQILEYFVVASLTRSCGSCFFVVVVLVKMKIEWNIDNYVCEMMK